MGPKRDIIKALQTAVRERGMKFGVSSHRAFNWKYFVRRPEFDNADPKYAGLYGRPMPFLFKEDAAEYKKRFEPQDQQFKEDWLARTCELVDKYDPDLVWFDFGITNSRETTGEAIYGTTHWKTYGEGPTKTSTGHLAEHKDQPFTAKDIRFTKKGETLYAILLDWPESRRVSIQSLAEHAETASINIRNVKLLGSEDEITWQRDDEGLHVELPESRPCEFASILEIN
jgi:alpha-L-fucosidase